MPLLDFEVVTSLILLLVLSFDRFHTSYRTIYFIALATSSGQNKQNQNVKIFACAVKFSGKKLSISELGVPFPQNNGINCSAVGFYTATTHVEAELGMEAEQFQVGTLHALLRKSALLKKPGFWGLERDFGSGASPVPVLQSVTFIWKHRKQCIEQLCAGQCSSLALINSSDWPGGEQRLVFRSSRGHSSNLVWVH